MKKIITLGLLVILSFPIIAETTMLRTGYYPLDNNIDDCPIEAVSLLASEGTAEDMVKNAYLGTRPLGTIFAGFYGIFDLLVEYRTAFDKSWALNTVAELAFLPDDTISGALGIGIQYNIVNNYLDGPYISVQPGMTFGSELSWYIYPECGYQWVFDNGFSFGGYSGYQISPEMSLFKYGFIMGLSFSDPLYQQSK